MSQLHFYVPDEIAKRIQHRADQAGLTLSRYVAELVKREVALDTAWPEGYFDHVFGQWEGEPLQRAAQGSFENRAAFD